MFVLSLLSFSPPRALPAFPPGHCSRYLSRASLAARHCRARGHPEARQRTSASVLFPTDPPSFLPRSISTSDSRWTPPSTRRCSRGSVGTHARDPLPAPSCLPCARLLAPPTLPPPRRSFCSLRKCRELNLCGNELASLSGVTLPACRSLHISGNRLVSFKARSCAAARPPRRTARQLTSPPPPRAA